MACSAQRALEHVRPALALATVLTLAACPGPRLVKVAPFAAESTTVGLIADSQLQTDRSHSRVPSAAGAFEDQLVDVALRPIALRELGVDLMSSF